MSPASCAASPPDSAKKRCLPCSRLTIQEFGGRAANCWDTPGDSGERGRTRTQKGAYYGTFQTEGEQAKLPPTERPPLPPGVEAGGHGGSHGYLMADFVEAILADRKPLVDVSQALVMTVGGIVAHKSALKGGELLRVPQYVL